ncbi:MAG: hypothetical protein L0027_07415 [Candidatus Rokubacteria bacterium]|nr:hypothetical protein [Candidatus Rokubacteria bacterium]
MSAPPPAGREPESIELPAPTAWPMVAALGITLIAAGLVTHVAVSLVGLVLGLAGGVGWWRQVLPVEGVEHVPLRPVSARPTPVVPSRVAVARLRLGEGGHRTRIPVEVAPISSGMAGGLVGGVAMAVVALVYGLVVQGSLWFPINLLSAVAMPRMAAADVAALRAFDPAALILGIIAHGIVSVLAGLLYAVILPMLPRRHMLWGGVIAPLLWTGFLWAVLGFINPALNARVSWPWFIASQVAFGLVTGYVVSRAQPVRTMQSWPLLARAGLETPGDPGPEGRR